MALQQGRSNTQALVTTYQEIILKEAKLISRDNMQKSVLNKVLRINNYSYCLEFKDLLRIAEEVTKSEETARKIINELFEKGLIIKVDEDCFRSIHMDFMIRLSDVRIYPKAQRMVLSSRFGVTAIQMFPSEARAILPIKESTCEICRELYKAMLEFLDNKEEIVNLFREALEEYFLRKGSRGFDPYQALAIIEALKNNKPGYVIVAPTGSGKTEVFLTLGILTLLKEFIKGKRKKIIIVYPRKMLEVDQAGRIIEFLRILNQKFEGVLGKNPFKVFLRDGDTNTISEAFKSASNDEDLISFRGISCGKKGKLFIKKEKGTPKVICSETNEEYSFVIPITSSEVSSANVIITTWNTLMYRIVSAGKANDLNVNDLLSTSMIILDEAHEYDSVQSAIISYTISILRELISLRRRGELKCIVSTATLPEPVEYAKALLNLSKEKIVDLSFKHLSSSIPNFANLSRRLVVTLFIQMLPRSSWMTYLVEALAIQLFLFKSYKLSGKEFLPQSIAFINNIKEINRVRSVLENQLSLGSPLDNLCVRRFTCEDMNPRNFRNIVSHYLSISEKFRNKILSIVKCEKENATIYDDLRDLYAIVYSGVSLPERSEIYEKMLKREIATILATSSLELGMDYSSVSIIFNVGSDKPESLIQRFGRGGRSPKSMFVTLAIQIMRNNPLDYRSFNQKNLVNVITQSLKGRSFKIPRELSAIRVRMSFNLLLILRALLRNSSGTKRVREEGDLVQLLEELIDIAEQEEFKTIVNATGLLPSEDEYRGFVELLRKLGNFYRGREYSWILDIAEEMPEKFAAYDLSNAYLKTAKSIVSVLKEKYKYEGGDLGELFGKLREKTEKCEKAYSKLYEDIENAIECLHGIYIGDVYKTEIREMLKSLNESAKVLDKLLKDFEGISMRFQERLDGALSALQCEELHDKIRRELYNRRLEFIEICKKLVSTSEKIFEKSKSER